MIFAGHNLGVIDGDEQSCGVLAEETETLDDGLLTDRDLRN